jgi:hypothetical protein
MVLKQISIPSITTPINDVCSQCTHAHKLKPQKNNHSLNLVSCQNYSLLQVVLWSLLLNVSIRWDGVSHEDDR